MGKIGSLQLHEVLPREGDQKKIAAVSVIFLRQLAAIDLDLLYLALGGVQKRECAGRPGIMADDQLVMREVDAIGLELSHISRSRFDQTPSRSPLLRHRSSGLG